MKLKLLVDTKSKRVIFAEANKDFVDFLFTLLSLPIGTVIKLLSSNAMVGSLGKLYKSVENLSSTYLRPNLSKKTILSPKTPMGISLTPLLLSNGGLSKMGQRLYVCPRIEYGNSSGFHRYVADNPRAQCPQCKSQISTEVSFVATEKGSSSSASGSGGYVKDVATYMVMDDLEVKPLSMASSLALLSKFNVKDSGALKEKMVSVGITEGLKLLKASMETKTVLTDVFLMKQ